MKYLSIIQTLLLMAISFLLGALIFNYNPSQSFKSNISTNLLTNIFENESSDISYSASLEEVSKFLQNNSLYKDKSFDENKLREGAIKGMVSSLEDPYTVYFSKDEYKEFMDSLNGTFEGIGAEIGIREEQLIVVSPLKDTPADKAGILPKDKILAIDDLSTKGMTVEEAVTKIRGEKDTEVKLTIRRDLENLEIKIKRDVIIVPNVEFEIKNDVGIIKVSTFQKDTAKQVEEKLLDLRKSKITKVVLDLRYNTGGYLDSSVDLVDLFVGKDKVVVTEQGRDEKIMQVFKTRKDNQFEDMNLVLLINEGSASASEITAGALKDLNNTKLIGQKTFGKGVVQQIKEFDDDSVLKYTVAKWLTPNGITIDKEGIEPDIKIEISKEDYQEDRDPQLERALEELK